LKRSKPKIPEDILLIKAIKDSNIPKFLKDDLPLFNAIIVDLFPNCSIELERDSIFIKNIEKT
jgi:dynein heavy chain